MTSLRVTICRLAVTYLEGRIVNTTEYRLVTLRERAEKLVPGETNGVSVLTVDFLNSIPQLEEAMAGWEPVSFQIIPIDEEFLLSILLRTEFVVPDTVDND